MYYRITIQKFKKQILTQINKKKNLINITKDYIQRFNSIIKPQKLKNISIMRKV